MLALDSLVLDLIFAAGATPTPEVLIDALGGEDAAKALQLFDPDANDPRIELQLSPSVPFRRRGERRLMIMDDSVAPMREDPRADPIVPLDLRPYKEKLIGLVDKCGCRLGRIMALGTWGEAIIVARTARDLRAVELMSWVLDPTVDAEGRRRAQPLNQTELEQKILSYEKRLEELDEKQILASIGPAKFERRGTLLVLDVLESDGTWDVRKSYAMEVALSAIDKFSLFPGAPRTPGVPTPTPTPTATPAPAPTATPAPIAPEPTGKPLHAADRSGRVVLVFPDDRWDLDVAAALGKRDWSAVLRTSDPISGALRERVHRDGAGFIAPLAFLSEVFIDGKPLSRPQFDKTATPVQDGVRSLEVHCPRFGAALLLDVPNKGRFITSEIAAGTAILELVAQ